MDSPIGRTTCNRAYGSTAIDGNAIPDISTISPISDATSYTIAMDF